MRRAVLLALSLSLPLVAGCVVDAGANDRRCGPLEACPEDLRCYRPPGLRSEEPGFCVGALDASLDAGVDAGCTPTGAETCNTADDDCDGTIDEGFDLASPETCGSCDVECVAPNPDCVPDGSGGRTCGAGCAFAMCGAACIDTSRDEANCGGCAVSCDAREDCVSGACSCGGAGADCAGTTTSTCCGTSCVDLNTSNAHCGGCGAVCPSEAACVDQQCACGTTADCRAPRRCVAGVCL